jgi:uncharacterized membrane protein
MRVGSVSVFRGWNPIRQSLWFVPVMCVLAGVASSFLVLWIDGLFDYKLVPRWMTGGPDAALAILSSIATSMVSLAALVLTITMVVVQLAMGQFSPRIVQTILKDKPSQLAIGIFVGTFAFAMIAMRDVLVGSSGSSGRVPGLAVVVAFLLVLVSIAVLVVYVHHIGSALRVSALIELVGSDTRSLLDRHYPGPNGLVDDAVIPASRSGVVCHVETDRLIEIAAEADCVFELVPAFGEFVPAGSPLLRAIHGDPNRIRDDAADQIVVGLERTLGQDVSYGLRMLVDIAERSLADSPFLDPTTAVQAIDRLHDCLRQLARRPFPDGRYRDERGDVRLVIRVMDWDAYVHLAFDEIREAGAGTPQVARRLRASLLDLCEYAPADRRAALEDQMEMLDQAVRNRAPEYQLGYYLTPDRQGIGVAAGAHGDAAAARFGRGPRPLRDP